MCDNDCYYSGREERFWPLSENIARIYKTMLEKRLTKADIAAMMEVSHKKTQEMKTLPELATSSSGGPSSAIEDLTIDEDTLPPFKYRPLEEAESIRVLILHPGKPSDPLRGTIRHQLYSRVSYQAISYCWGNDSYPCSMLLDRQRMPLTQSLYEALVRLRQPDYGRILWADGICINQADNEEKSIQVGLMPEIFKQAKVLVYLGREESQSDTIPYLVEKLQNFDRKAESTSPSTERTPEQFLASNSLPPQFHMSWLALVAFLCRPWFMRMWVVQEIVLAREVRFFCGKWEMGWRELGRMANGLAKVLQKALPNLPEETFVACDQAAGSLALMLALRETRSLVERRLQEIRRFMIHDNPTLSAIDTVSDDKMRDAIVKDRDYVLQACREHQEIYDNIEDIVIGLPDQVLPSRSPMLYLIGLFSQNQATRPQDRLYALAGLSSDITLADFPPEYGETIQQTNLRFSRLLVQKGQGMDLLYHATKWAYEYKNSHLPTWAADWTSPRSHYNHWLRLGWAYHGGWENIFAARSSIRLDNEFDMVLRATGFQVAAISTVIPFSINSIVKRHNKQHDPIQEMARFFRNLRGIFRGKPYFTGQTWEEVACRTLITDHLPKALESEPISETIQSYRQFLETLSRLDKIKETRHNEWGRKMIYSMPGNAVFKTESGHVGIAAEMTAPGDKIFMLQHSNLPFIIRPSSARPGSYSFLGGCYLHGLMAGKAWTIEHTPEEISLV